MEKQKNLEQKTKSGFAEWLDRDGSTIMLAAAYLLPFVIGFGIVGVIRSAERYDAKQVEIRLDESWNNRSMLIREETDYPAELDPNVIYTDNEIAERLLDKLGPEEYKQRYGLMRPM